MFYPEEFKARCKKAYPDNEVLHEKLEEGSEWVGRYLDDGADGKLPVDTILEATSLEELQALAQVEKEKRSLYAEWCGMYIEQSGSLH